MNRHCQSWEPALANFMVTIKVAKQSLSTLFASYSRISNFVYCRIHIWNVTEFVGIVVLMQPYKLLPSVKNFLLGPSFFYFLLYFYHIPCVPPGFQKMKVRLWDHISLSNNLLVLLWNLTKLSVAIFLSIFYKPYDFQVTTTGIMFHISTIDFTHHVEWSHNS